MCKQLNFARLFKNFSYAKIRIIRINIHLVFKKKKKTQIKCKSEK